MLLQRAPKNLDFGFPSLSGLKWGNPSPKHIQSDSTHGKTGPTGSVRHVQCRSVFMELRLGKINEGHEAEEALRTHQKNLSYRAAFSPLKSACIYAESFAMSVTEPLGGASLFQHGRVKRKDEVQTAMVNSTKPPTKFLLFVSVFRLGSN